MDLILEGPACCFEIHCWYNLQNDVKPLQFHFLSFASSALLPPNRWKLPPSKDVSKMLRFSNRCILKKFGKAWTGPRVSPMTWLSSIGRAVPLTCSLDFISWEKVRALVRLASLILWKIICVLVGMGYYISNVYSLVLTNLNSWGKKC